MTVHPTHTDVFGIANELCVSTITDVEVGLASQRASDAAEAIRCQEEEIHKVEIARIAAKHEEHEKQERLKQLDQDRLDIETAERQLQMQKQALRDANDDSSGSTSTGDPVRHISIHSIYSLLTMMSDISGNYKGQDEASAG